MKRVLSTILAIVMVLSVCTSLTFTASATVTEQEAKVNYEVNTNGLKNGELAFDVYLAPNQTINTAILSVKFDSTVFDVVTSK
jgi:PBP1b-binding outer membrane lipoprotein LpoB